jgi:hypothetical protein
MKALAWLILLLITSCMAVAGICMVNDHWDKASCFIALAVLGFMLMREIDAD